MITNYSEIKKAERCQCGGEKAFGELLCSECWFLLSGPLRAAINKGHGYRDAIAEINADPRGAELKRRIYKERFEKV